MPSTAVSANLDATPSGRNSSAKVKTPRSRSCRPDLVELSAELTGDAQELLVRRDLRAADAVQLASCSYLHGEAAQRIFFAASDDRLSTDPRAEGLTLLPRSCSRSQDAVNGPRKAVRASTADSTVGKRRPAPICCVNARPVLAYLTANLSSTGMTTTANGVPASSDTCGSGEPKALPPTIALS